MESRPNNFYCRSNSVLEEVGTPIVTVRMFITFSGWESLFIDGNYCMW